MPKRDSASSAQSSTPQFAANCGPCKRRKSRCDRVKPCGTCTLHNDESSCYPEAEVPREEEAKRPKANFPVESFRSIPKMPKNYLCSTHRAAEPRVQEMAATTPARVTPATAPTKEISPREKTSLEKTFAFAIPASALCDALLEFANSLLGRVSFLDIESQRKTIKQISSDEITSPRQTCMLFWTLAFAAQNIPSQHQLASTYIHWEKSNEHWRQLAMQIEAQIQPSNDANDKFLDVCIPTMQALWHSKYGQVTECWLAAGIGIRRAALLRFFESGFDDAYDYDCNKQMNRHFSVAHRLLLMDRWMCFNNLCPLGVARDELDKGAFALIDGSHRSGFPQVVAGLRVFFEQCQIILFEKGRLIRKGCLKDGTESQRSEATAFLKLTKKYLDWGEERLDKDLDERLGIGNVNWNAAKLLPLPIDQAFKIAEWQAACAYIACVTCMPFTHDQEADAVLRQASMKNARVLLELSPVFTKAISSQTIPLSMTRICNQLFSAFRAVFATKVKEDLLGSEKEALLGSEDSLFTPAEEAASVLTSLGNMQPNSISVDSVPSLLHDGIKCVEEMQRQGSPIATRVLRLVKEVMQRHPHLGNDQSNTNQNTFINGTSNPEMSKNTPMQGALNFDELVEAFLGSSNGMKETNDILASFLQDYPQDSIFTPFQ